METLFPREARKLDDEVWHIPDWLSYEEQAELVASCRTWFEQPAGLAHRRMPGGQQMQVASVSLGWYWYPYRYSRFLDDVKAPGQRQGPPAKQFPPELGVLARRAIDATYGSSKHSPVNTAMINRYIDGATMGLHQDNGERMSEPVISISLGASCNFRFGNNSDRSKPWTDLELRSGDLFVFGGSRRLSFHGVTRVNRDGSPLTAPGERINITLRTVDG